MRMKKCYEFYELYINYILCNRPICFARPRWTSLRAPHTIEVKLNHPITSDFHKYFFYRSLAFCSFT